MTLEGKPYPTGTDWQRKISTALGVKLGQENLTLAEAVEAIAELKADRVYLLKVRQPDDAGIDTTVHRTREGAKATMRETAKMWDEERLPHSITEIPVLK